MTAPLEDTPLRQLLERVARGEVSIDEAAGRLVRTNVPEALPGAGSPGLGSPWPGRLWQCAGGVGGDRVGDGRPGPLAALRLSRGRLRSGEIRRRGGRDLRRTSASRPGVPGDARLVGAQAAAVKGAFAEAVHNESARTVRVGVVEGSAAGRVVRVDGWNGGPSRGRGSGRNRAVGGCKVDLVYDVGVAGPHRLPSQRHRFERADAIVVVAGMEAALRVSWRVTSGVR